MHSRNLPKTLALISMFALGGCQFFGNLHLTSKSREKEPAAAMAAGTYGPATQAGRDYLRDNLTGLAIDAFNLALATGEDPAAAYNGLGVAYARLGRTDLAYRFFRKANMSDPSNAAYAHNLTSLVNSPAFTLNLMTRSALALAVRAEPAAEARTAERPARAPQVPGKLYRDGNRQFSLITVAPAPQSAVSGVESAANDGCSKRISPRTSQRCGIIPLPKIQSRNVRSKRVALAVPAATPKPAPVAEAAPAAAPKGKAKMFDLSGQNQTARPPASPEPSKPAVLSAAT